MEDILRILHLEDSPLDAELIASEIKRKGLSCKITLVDNGETYEQSLVQADFDLILSDYSLPRYNGMMALKCAQRVCPHIPFVFVTGEMGEERAIESLKQGAVDYVMKDRLAKLIPAIQHAMEVDRYRRKQHEMESALRKSEELYRQIVETALEGVCVLDKNGVITYVNNGMAEMVGYTPAEVIGRNAEEFFEPSADRTVLKKQLARRADGKKDRYENTILRKDGSKVHVIISASPILDNSRQYAGSLTLVTEITAHKHVEERLDEIARFTAENPSPILRMNRNGEILNSNPAADDIFSPMLCPERQRAMDELAAHTRQALSEKRKLEMELGCCGKTFMFAIVPVPEREYANLYGNDITERKQWEDRLLFQSNILNVVNDVLITVDRSYRITSWNKAAERMYGWKAEEVVGKPVSEILRSEMTPEERIALYALLEMDQPVSTELIQYTKDGRKLVVSGYTVCLRNAQGAEIGYVAVNRDVTERKRIENSIKESEAKLRSIFQSSPEAIAVLDNEGKIIDCNDRGLEMLEYASKNDLIGKDSISFLTPDDQPRARENMKLTFALGLLNGVEYNLVTSKGRVVPTRISTSTFRDAAGNVLGLLTIVSDISRRKKIEQALRESELRYRTLLDMAPDAILVHQDGKVVYCNAAVVQLYRAENFHQFLGKNPLEMIHPDDRPAIAARIQTVLGGGKTPLREFRGIMMDGTEVCVEMTAAAVTWRGKPAIQVIVRDTSERKETEMKLRRLNEELEQRVLERTQAIRESEKRLQQQAVDLQNANKELEAFSYSVSHDLRAPLRAMNGFAKILIEEAGGNLAPDLIHYLQLIQENALTMGELIDALLNFSRLGRKEFSRATVDMKSLFRSVVLKHKGREPERKVRVYIQPALPPAQADPTLIQQVIENLLSNAFKFTRHVEKPSIRIAASSKNAEIVYSVKDNGAGFDMQFYDKLFNVFQRLHDASEFEGTGVGLAFSKRIINRHGGTMWAEAVEGKGATFYFSLPVK